MASGPPFAGERRHPVVGAGEAERDQIGMQLLRRPALLATLAGLCLQPAGQLLGKGIELARALRGREPWLDPPDFRYFRIVLRDSPVRRAISRIGSCSRSAMRRMTFKSPMWITPSPMALGGISHGSNLNGN